MHALRGISTSLALAMPIERARTMSGDVRRAVHVGVRRFERNSRSRLKEIARDKRARRRWRVTVILSASAAVE